MEDQVVSNIDIDLSSFDNAQPVVDNQVVLCRTGEVVIKPTKSGLARLVIPLTFEEPATSTTGKAINPGFMTTVGFLLQPTGGLTAERVAEEVGKFSAAVLKTDKPPNFSSSNLEPYKGQLVRVKFVAQRNDPTRQDVKAWLKAA